MSVPPPLYGKFAKVVKKLLVELSSRGILTIAVESKVMTPALRFADRL
jgi:hypothetical protein